MTIPRTEAPHPEHESLDEYPTRDLVEVLVADQAHAVAAARAAATAIAEAVEAAVPRLQEGGRLVYAGAGTSGRLGLLDSVELNPTFSWPAERSLALLAGGERAIRQAVEGAEDDAGQGRRDIEALAPTPRDVVLLIAASGATPYVMGALEGAKAAGALAIGLANNPGSPLAEGADIAIVLDTGHELVSGSTRLKAGTAQKVALNAFSTAVMVRLHKVYGNLMVDLRPTNAKLVRRAIRLTALAAGTDEAMAEAALDACGYQVKVAIVCLARGLSPDEARQRLARSHGSVRAALAP